MNKFLLAILLVTFGSTAYAQAEPLEGSIESLSVELLLDENNRGTVVIHDCKDCPVLHVNADTKAFRSGKPIPLTQARLHVRKGATVFYDHETKVVTRIRM